MAKKRALLLCLSADWLSLAFEAAVYKGEGLRQVGVACRDPPCLQDLSSEPLSTGRTRRTSGVSKQLRPLETRASGGLCQAQDLGEGLPTPSPGSAACCGRSGRTLSSAGWGSHLRTLSKTTGARRYLSSSGMGFCLLSLGGISAETQWGDSVPGESQGGSLL